jgi:hypothetical protein
MKLSLIPKNSLNRKLFFVKKVKPKAMYFVTNRVQKISAVKQNTNYFLSSKMPAHVSNLGFSDNLYFLLKFPLLLSV